jgi:hypothetical protein
MARVGEYNANCMGPVATQANKGTAAAYFKIIQIINTAHAYFDKVALFFHLAQQHICRPTNLMNSIDAAFLRNISRLLLRNALITGTFVIDSPVLCCLYRPFHLFVQARSTFFYSRGLRS